MTNKITLPTPYGKLESEVSFSRETPEGMFSLFNMDIDIQPLEMCDSSYFQKDTFVKINLDSNYELNISFRLEYINTKKSDMTEDKDYYHIVISELVRIPMNKQFVLLVNIDVRLAKIIFPEKPSKEEIINRVRKEMASSQTKFNPSSDGRLPKGTFYGWGGSK